MASSDFSLHWYPGHMTKAKRTLQARSKEIDFIVEVADARGPRATRNPELQEFIADRPKLLVLAKADLADDDGTHRWLKHLKDQEARVIAVSLLDGHGIRQVRDSIVRLTKQLAGSSRKGRHRSRKIPGVVMPRLTGPQVRGMVVGMPSTGKSSLIRGLGGGKVATGNRPGVTRGVQELSLGGNVTLLDTPGLLWPRAFTGEVALHIAWLGYAGERAYDFVEAGKYLLSWLVSHYPERLGDRYGLVEKDLAAHRTSGLEQIAARHGRSGSEREKESAGAKILLHDFRLGALGRFTLEHPKNSDEVESKI